MTSRTKTIGIIVIAVVLAAGLSLLGLGLSGVLFQGGATVQTGTTEPEAAEIGPSLPTAATVSTEDMALIAQGEPLVVPTPILEPTPDTTATSPSVPSEDIALVAQGEPLVVPTPILEPTPDTTAVSPSVTNELPSLTPEALNLLAFGNEPAPYVTTYTITGSFPADTYFTGRPLEIAVSADPASAVALQLSGDEDETIVPGSPIEIVALEESSSMGVSGISGDEAEYFVVVTPDQIMTADGAAAMASTQPVITVSYGSQVIVIPFSQFYGEAAMDYSY